MRINQIQNLCWLGNVVVFLGLGYAGYLFYGAWQQRKTPPPPVEWPESEVREMVPLWPPSIGKFKHIWDTYVNGVVPPPPPPPPPPQKKEDDGSAFKRSVKFAGGLENYGTPMNSIAIVKIGTETDERHLRIGSIVNGWRLVRFSCGGDPKVDQLHFQNLENAEKRVIVEGKPLDRELDPKLAEKIELKPGEPEVERGRIDPQEQGFRGLAADTWQIPWGEVQWYEAWGKEDLLPVLDLRPNTLPDGTVKGIKVAGNPGDAKVLVGPRGLVQGDVILSIEGVPVSSQEDVVLYLENEGKDLSKYRVRLIRRGKEITLVYLVGRPNPGELVSTSRRKQRPK